MDFGLKDILFSLKCTLTEKCKNVKAKTFCLCHQRAVEILRKWPTVFKNKPKQSSSMLRKLIAMFEQIDLMADSKVGMKTKQKTRSTRH